MINLNILIFHIAIVISVMALYTSLVVAADSNALYFQVPVHMKVGLKSANQSSRSECRSTEKSLNYSFKIFIAMKCSEWENLDELIFS